MPRMVAPSFVTVMSPSALWIILSIPGEREGGRKRRRVVTMRAERERDLLVQGRSEEFRPTSSLRGCVTAIETNTAVISRPETLETSVYTHTPGVEHTHEVQYLVRLDAFQPLLRALVPYYDERSPELVER